MITPATLEKIGITLYGEHWKSGLAKALNLSSARRMREWYNEERTIPQSIKPELIKLLKIKTLEIESLLTELDK